MNILGIEIHTLQEVADMLGVTTASLRKYVKEGKLTTTTIGGRKYITEESIKKYILEGDKKTLVEEPTETNK